MTPKPGDLPVHRHITPYGDRKVSAIVLVTTLADLCLFAGRIRHLLRRMRFFYVMESRMFSTYEGAAAMLIAYDSRTGNVRRFVDKLDLRSVKLMKTMRSTSLSCSLTYTTGSVKRRTGDILSLNAIQLLQGVSASGNRNWGDGSLRAPIRSRTALSTCLCSANLNYPERERDVEHFHTGR